MNAFGIPMPHQPANDLLFLYLRLSRTTNPSPRPNFNRTFVALITFSAIELAVPVTLSASARVEFGLDLPKLRGWALLSNLFQYSQKSNKLILIIISSSTSSTSPIFR